MRALLSVSEKSGLIELGRGLTRLGVELVSTGGTAKVLAAAGLPVLSVSDVTGFPEMMDGRVKTLHPAVHAGILARRSRQDDLAAIGRQGITAIDLVVVNLYPFARASANRDTPFEGLVEEIDIGGPSMVRAAAKNFRDVLVVVDPGDYPRVLEELARPDGPTLEFRLELMKKAFAHTADYDRTIAETLASVDLSGDTMTRRSLPKYRDSKELRYGENPHQKALWVPVLESLGPRRWQVHQGKELSYTNLLDLDAAARIALEFTEPAGVVIKHTNPCGVATGASIAEAYVHAREADPLSAFGGIVGLNRIVDDETARALTATFIEAIIAPAIADAARPILATKANLRVVTVDFSAMFDDSAPIPQEERSFLGGTLMQDPDRVTEARAPWPQGDSPRVVTRRAPTSDEWTALRFAWRVCAHVKSNAVVFTGPDRTLAVGAGQMSRVDAVRVAVLKAAPESLVGSVAASDAFFPFRDGLDAIVAAGATAVVQPGGSVRDAEVIAAADDHGITMVFTGRRHFRH
jgi:phosphoribosylaminoimidazolecarboxamide formyltransferase / IMP cyclohydrolase